MKQIDLYSVRPRLTSAIYKFISSNHVVCVYSCRIASKTNEVFRCLNSTVQITWTRTFERRQITITTTTMMIIIINEPATSFRIEIVPRFCECKNSNNHANCQRNGTWWRLWRWRWIFDMRELFNSWNIRETHEKRVFDCISWSNFICEIFMRCSLYIVFSASRTRFRNIFTIKFWSAVLLHTFVRQSVFLRTSSNTFAMQNIIFDEFISRWVVSVFSAHATLHPNIRWDVCVWLCVEHEVDHTKFPKERCTWPTQI